MGVYTQPYRSDELYHFGIKGMHWGIRRYQNPDGTWKNGKAKDRHAKQQVKSENGGSNKWKDRSRGYHSKADIKSKKDMKKYNKIYDKIETEEYKKSKKINTALGKDYFKEVDRIQDVSTARADAEYERLKNLSLPDKQKGLTDGQKKALKIGLTAVGIGLAAYGAYKIGSQLSDENDKWHNTRKLVNKYTSALAKEREANNTYSSRLADKNSSVASLIRADRRRFKAADKRFDASARMTEYSQTKLTEKPNIFQQHANKQHVLGSSGRTSSGHSKDGEEMLRSFAENERDKERIKSQTASTRDAFRKATSKPTSLETIRKSASTGEHNVQAIKLEFGSGGNNSTGSDYAKKILAANNATSKSLGQVKTDYSDMDDYVQELLRRSRR